MLGQPGRDLLSPVGAGRADRGRVDNATGEPRPFQDLLQRGDGLADHTNRERPPAATILYGVEIPSAGGGTSVANMRAAYAALPEDERRRLESLTTFNGLDEHADTREEDRDKYGKPIEHPMVRTHPVHGTRAVYVHISKATHIDGMTPDASKVFMHALLDRVIQPGIVYQHAWRKGDVLVIDDRATMHRAHGDYDRGQSRVLWRIIVEGDRPRLVRAGEAPS